jgi:Ca-activated chloride channel family protein
MTLVLSALLLFSGAAVAQDTSGTLVPAGGGAPLDIESQEVQVRIDNGIAVTTITQIFRNNRSNPLEAVYSFPVPIDASVSNFSMWINGKEVIGEVLEKQEARRIYESITRQRRDPGLLEQVSFKLFQVRVFPVPANGTQKIQIAYYQPVSYDTGYGTYVYPLEAKTKEHSRVTGTFKLDVDLSSDIPLTNVTSPSHKNSLAVAETSKGHWRASIETRRATIDRDFVLAYEHERERTGLTLVPFRKEGEDGTFMLLLTAGRELERVSTCVNYTFLLDVSGSMGDEHKLDHAVRMIEGLLPGLGPEDRFNVVTFNISPGFLFKNGPVVADEKHRREAIEFLRSQTARGGTELLPALEAVAGQQQENMANVLVLLSDGDAADGDDHSRFQRLLGSKGGLRIFSIGVGNEVNRPLLNTLALSTGGLCDFISTQDDVERKTALVRTKLVHQVAENLEVKVEGVKVYEVSPSRFPNLFRGQQVAAYGRYRGSGRAKVVVSGTIGGQKKSLELEAEFPQDDRTHPEVRRMWAWKRTDDLLQEIRSQGESPSRVREVVKLGKDYSIVTPYTSFLVLESDEQFKQFGIEQRNARLIQEDRVAQAQRADRPSTGGTGPSGGGASIELGFVGLLAALGAGHLLRKKG